MICLMPERDVARALRREALATDRLFSALEKLSPQQRAELIAQGGVDAILPRIRHLENEVAEHAPEGYWLELAMNPPLDEPVNITWKPGSATSIPSPSSRRTSCGPAS